MRKERPLKYRWVVLFALSVWLALTLAIAFGTAQRKGVTVAFAFVPLAMILIALAPISMPRIVGHRWFIPISATWGCCAFVAIHLVGSWLLGYGHECNRLVIFTSLGAYGALVMIWMAAKSYRWMVALVRRKFVHGGQDSQVKAAIA